MLLKSFNIESYLAPTSVKKSWEISLACQDLDDISVLRSSFPLMHFVFFDIIPLQPQKCGFGTLSGTFKNFRLFCCSV